MTGELLMVLPMLYYFWSGMLIAWATVSGYGIFQVIGGLHRLHGRIRRTDYVYLFGSVAIAMTLTALLFVVPEFTSTIIDTLLGINFWCSVFLALGTASTLSLWPVICASNSPAVFKRLAKRRSLMTPTQKRSAAE